MPKKNIILLLTLLILIILLIVIVVVIFNQNKSNDTDSSTTEETLDRDTVEENDIENNNNSAITLSGISLSPKSFTGTDFGTFMEKVSDSGEILTAAGNIDDLENKNSGAHTVAGLSDGYSYTPVILTHIVNPGNKGLKEPLTPETEQRYLDSIAGFLEEYDIPYFSMGVEVNILYEHSTDEYNQFVQFYSKVAETVKTTSPDTQLIVVFQLERIKGLKGGLFGGINDTNQNNWNLINDFPEADIIGFTTYPYLIYSTPSEIPSNYYSEILDYVDETKKIAFLEVGWPWKIDLAGWESSETEQLQFIQLFSNQIQSLSPELIVWPFLFDQEEIPEVIFKYLGLLRDDQSTSSAYEEWQKL